MGIGAPAPESPPKASFDGCTYDARKDEKRLRTQLGLVYTLMRDGEWRTLGLIVYCSRGSESGVSARLRDFRKARFADEWGVAGVDRRRVQSHHGYGTWEYRMRLR